MNCFVLKSFWLRVLLNYFCSSFWRWGAEIRRKKVHKGKVQKSRQPESKVVPARRHDLHRGANRTTSRQDGRVAKADVTDVKINRADVQAYLQWRKQGQR